MSTIDDKSKESSDSAADPSANDSSFGHEAHQSKDGAVGFIVLFFMLGMVASLIVGWIIFPKLLYSQKPQPIDFNHASHVELVENGCESCHFFREDGSYAGVPKLEQCIECHEEVQGESEDEARFVEEYVNKNREVPWHIYSKQPDCVFFSHAAHVKKADMDCVTCHGHIGTSEHLKVYEENRITGLSRDIYGKNISGIKINSWDSMKMDVCADCHQKEIGSKGACFVCHK
jgi:hypothetical protein